MALPRLTKLELQIMEALWNLGPTSIREIQEAFPAKGRPAYTTIQTTVYRMEGKKAYCSSAPDNIFRSLTAEYRCGAN